MRKIIRQRDVVKIRKHHNAGHQCPTISQALGLDHDRVAEIIKSFPAADKAHDKRAEKAARKKAKADDEPYKAPVKRSKAKKPAAATAPLKVKAKLPAPVPGSTAIE